MSAWCQEQRKALLSWASQRHSLLARIGIVLACAGRQEIDFDLAFGERLAGRLDANDEFCSSGGREAGEECLVELEVDSCQVVDIGGRDAVDAPNSGGDEGRFGGKVNGDVAEVDAGDVADREYPRACDLLPVS